MAVPRIGSKGRAGDRWPGSGDLLVDQMVSCYLAWSGDAAVVSDAYQRWVSGSADEEPARFAAYMAALDQEASSATSYAQAISELETWSHRDRRLSDDRREGR